MPNGAQGAQPRGAGGRHTPHAGERPRRGPEASTLTHLTFSRARKKGASRPLWFPCSHDTQATPCHFRLSATRQALRSIYGPDTHHPTYTPPGSHPRHAGPAAPLHPGTSRDSSTHMGCRPYPLNTPPLSCLDGCAAVPAGDERTAKPVRERPASRRGSATFFQRSKTGEAIALKTLLIGSGSGLAGMKCIPSNNRPCVPLTALAAFHSRADTFA